MKAWDFKAVIFDGAVYCVKCLPKGISVDGDNVSPIFATDEWDAEPVCDKCGQLHDYMNILQH